MDDKLIDTFLNEEIEKCVILCANCHREVEAGLITEEELSL